MTPFSRRMFPHTVTIRPAGWTAGGTGSPARADGQGVDVPANVVLRRDEMHRLGGEDAGSAAGSLTRYSVSFPGDATAGQLAAIAAVAADATISWGAIDLIAEAPAAPVMRGAAFRAFCRSIT